MLEDHEGRLVNAFMDFRIFGDSLVRRSSSVTFDPAFRGAGVRGSLSALAIQLLSGLTLRGVQDRGPLVAP